MDKKNGKNYWKTATFILIPIFMSLVFFNLFLTSNDDDEVVDFVHFTITQEEFTAFTNVMEDQDPFEICNIPTGEYVEIKVVG